MKKMYGAFFALALLFAVPSDAQIKDKFYAEVNIGRYAENLGLSEYADYKNALTYLNGLKLGFEFSKK